MSKVKRRRVAFAGGQKEIFTFFERNAFFLRTLYVSTILPETCGACPRPIPSARELAELARSYRYSVERLANALRLSPRSMQRWFSERFRCAPREWITQLRVRDAAELLERGYSVKETAHAVGIVFPTSLNEPFHAVFGCAPKEYARRHAPRWQRRRLELVALA
jgi:AraC-like DNA-binding protein